MLVSYRFLKSVCFKGPGKHPNTGALPAGTLPDRITREPEHPPSRITRELGRLEPERFPNRIIKESKRFPDKITLELERHQRDGPGAVTLRKSRHAVQKPQKNIGKIYSGQ